MSMRSEKIREAIINHSAGSFFIDIANHFGVTPWTITYHVNCLRKMGYKIKADCTGYTVVPPNENEIGITEEPRVEEVVAEMTEPQNKPSAPIPRFDALIVADKVYTIAGVSTGFDYVISARSDTVKIETKYCPEIELDAKDIIAFAKELVQIAAKLDELKKNVW